MDLRCRVDDQLIEGEIVTEPADVVGLPYTDIDGMTKDCYSSAIATYRIHWRARLSNAPS